MPVSELHTQVAKIALGAAAGHGFALGGGNAYRTVSGGGAGSW